MVVEEDPDPDVSYLDQDDFEDRRAAYKRGDFKFLGVRAEAEVVIESTDQVLSSPGLWGIEGDLDEEELARIVSEEWSVLRDVLKTVGVPTDKLPLEADRAWIEWRT